MGGGDLSPVEGWVDVPDHFPSLICYIMARVRLPVCRKARGSEGKVLGTREAGFDVGKGRGSTRKQRSGVLMQRG